MADLVPLPQVLTRPTKPTLADVFAAEQRAGGESCGRVCPWDEQLVCARPAGHGGQVFLDVHVHPGPTGPVQWHENDPYTPTESPPAGAEPAADTPVSVLATLAAELGWDDPGALRDALTELHDRRYGY